MLSPIRANTERVLFEAFIPNRWIRTSFYVGAALIAIGVIGAAVKAFKERNQPHPEVSKGFTATATAGVVLTIPAVVVMSGLMPSAQPQVPPMPITLY